MSHFYRTIDDGIKLASLMTVPANDVASLNKMTTIELDRLVITEPQSLANGSLGHLLPLIFKPFTANVPQAHTLQIPLSKILHRNARINTLFSQHSPDDIIPLYDSEARLWNWALPTTPPPSSTNSNDALPQTGAERFTHEEIFSSFFNALGTAMAKKLDTPRSATRTWSASNSTVAVSGSDIKRKPDLVLSDDIKPKWGNIRVCAELTYSQYKPAQRITKAADTQAYLLLSNQPWRRFAFILSFTNQYRELRVLLYDHAGGVVTPCIQIHQNPDSFTHIIAAVLFGSPECIGYDSTVTFWKSISLPPPPGTKIPDHRPFKNLPTRTNRSITIPAEHVSEPFTALHKNPQELPANHEAEFESISPVDDPLESEFNDDLEFFNDPIEELTTLPPSPPPPPPPPSHTLLQPLVVTSAPLLNLISQAPQQGADPDATFSSNPHPSHFPHTHQSPAQPCGQIRVKDKVYTILKILFTTKGLIGRGTVCYLVSLDGEEYIVKDHWVQGGEAKVLNEINMLKAMSGIHGVPELFDYWLVERSDNIVDQTRDYRHAEKPSIRGTHRTHVRLVMRPCARPLHAFRTLKEFVRAIRDITIIQRKAAERGILHRDCSLYNAMIMGEPNDSNGLLIDWEFAVFITSNDQYSIGGTGTIPFMSRALLAQMAELQAKAAQQEARKSSSKTLALPPSRVTQSFADDLESLFYVFVYVCIKYSGPNDQERQEPVPDSLPDSWSSLDLDVCKLRKVFFFAVSTEEARLEKQFHPYFEKLIPLAKEWCSILKDNMEIRITFERVVELLERHLATLQDDEERSSTTEKLRRSAEELTRRLNKRAAEAGESTSGSSSSSSPQSAKRKKHEERDPASDSDTGSVAHATVESEDSDWIYEF
ncbi:hypothetical protein DEU56DRAFT_913695 [Suillus clintonianus]|uniref:uncharacterized protein n=1 Tax=Suillus clintonianus TaxID=1904413 RepID=UPI001B85EBD0|nr:uncharacterized protein DEU56DRAFT_913695 [Suillus clintonianus]KAG2134507.1 hypothetical protein DEU56DRAFT_913695 [Suillus clintonianus]